MQLQDKFLDVEVKSQRVYTGNFGRECIIKFPPVMISNSPYSKCAQHIVSSSFFIFVSLIGIL